MLNVYTTNDPGVFAKKYIKNDPGVYQKRTNKREENH